MNIKTAVLGFTIAGVTALTASCSGSSDSNESSGGSSSSSAGKGTSGSSAGTSTKGGANGTGGAGSAGTSGNGGGGRNTGGNFPTGGFNFGGAGFDPSDFMCNPVPTKGAACAAGTQPCTDGTAVCYCQASKWTCLDLAGGAAGAGPGGGFGQLDCPATEPMSGDACGDTLGFCPYGQNAGCACYSGMWACN